MAGNGTEAGKLYLGLHLNSKPIQSQMTAMQGKLQNSFSGIGASIGKVLAGAISVTAITAFSKKCLELGSDLAEVQNVVDVTFNSMNESVNRFAQDAAANFGLSETMAKRFTGTFGAMAKAFGFSENAAYDMSTSLTGLAGDVASFYNIDQDAAYTKLKSVFTGETESLKDLGVVMTQTALDQFALQNGFGKTTSAMTEAEKVSLRYQFVMSRLSTASGDFARTSDSWANQVRLLKLQFDSLCGVIGQTLIAALTPAIKALNSFMTALVKAANTFKAFVFSLMGKTSEDMAAGSGAAADGLDDMASSAGDAASGVSGVGDAVSGAAQQIKRSLAGFDQITKLTDQASSGGSGSGSGSSAAGSGIAASLGDTSSALKSEAYELSGTFGEGFLSALSSWFENQNWLQIGTSLYDGLKNALDSVDWAGLATKVSQLAGNITGAVIGIGVGFIKGAWEDLKKEFDRRMAEYDGNVLEVILSFAFDLLTIPSKIEDWIDENITQPFLSGVANAIGIDEESPGWQLGTKIFEGLKKALLYMIPGLGPLLMLSDLVVTIGDVKDNIPASQKTLGSFKASLASWKDEMSDKVVTFQAKLTSWTDGLKSKCIEGFAAAVSSWSDKIEDAKKWISGFGATVASWWNGLKKDKYGVFGWLGSFGATVSSWYNGLKKDKYGVFGWLGSFGATIASWWNGLKKDKYGVFGWLGSFGATIASWWNGLKKDKYGVYGWLGSFGATITQWWNALTGKTVSFKADGGVFANGKWSPIQQYASGGLPGGGQLFVAREAGPELVGTLGGHTAVMNNDQIVASVSAGVARAIAGIKFYSRERSTPHLAVIGASLGRSEEHLSQLAQRAAETAAAGGTAQVIELLKQILAALQDMDRDIYLDGQSVKDRIVALINRNTRATGVCEIMV